MDKETSSLRLSVVIYVSISTVISYCCLCELVSEFSLSHYNFVIYCPIAS